MKLIKSLNRQIFDNLFLILIIILGAFLRLWQLGEVPQGVTHDELGYIFNAYSIALTGKNVFGENLPLFTWMTPGGFPFMPGTIYSMVPIFWIFSLSAMSGRLLAAVLGSLDIFLLYLLIKKLFNNRAFALLSAFFLAISPWHLHFSRSAYDPNFSLFFYLLGIVVFLHEIEKRKLPLISSLCFLIGVYSYRGMSIVAFPLFLTLMVYAFLKKAKKVQLVFFSFVIVIIFSSLIFIIQKYGHAYTAEGQAVFSSSKMQEDIDSSIREASGPLIIRRIFLNKPTTIINRLRENYLKAYSPDFLFLYTEPHQIYSIWSRGRLYFIDAIFIILGFVYLVTNYKKNAWIIFAFSIIGGLPGGVGGLPYSARNYFLSIVFPIFSAGGILYILRLQALKRLIPVIISVIVLLYSYAFFSYLFDYYFRYSQQGAEAWAKSLKDFSYIINSNKNKYNNVIVGPASFGDIVQYAFYNNISPKEVQQVWKKRNLEISNATFKIDNIDFYDSCPSENQLKDRKHGSLIITRIDCFKEATPSATIDEFYRNIIWKIYK